MQQFCLLNTMALSITYITLYAIKTTLKTLSKKYISKGK